MINTKMNIKDNRIKVMIRNKLEYSKDKNTVSITPKFCHSYLINQYKFTISKTIFLKRLTKINFKIINLITKKSKIQAS